MSFVMYDDEVSPQRNDPCWCGSGKKYKKCHLPIDNHLQQLYEKGEEVPRRNLLKTPSDIEGVKKSAEINIGILDYVQNHIKAGISTEEIDEWVYHYTIDHGATPAPLGFEGYPKSVCTSINEVVCHGIPSKEDILQDGDIINVDCSTILNGYYSDSSRMFLIGDVDEDKKKLVKVTRDAMLKGLEQVRPWGHLGDVGAAVKKYAESFGYSVVKEFGGHGIGRDFHEDPFVSHVAKKGTGPILAPGLMFTIEPMINMGKDSIDMSDSNGWTVRTLDRSLTAQWEIQVVVNEHGYELLCW